MLLLGAALISSGCVSTQDIEALQSQIANLERQLLQIQTQSPTKTEVQALAAQVSKQNEGLLKSEADMQLRLDQLSSQIEALQSRLEDTNYRLGNLSQQIAATNQELKAFRAQQRLAPVEVDPNAPPAPPPAQVDTDPRALYDAAYSDYVRGSYDLAIRQFQEYLTAFPTTDLADNAAYWIGECYYRQKKFKEAITEFDRVLERYAGSDKVPSALLKKGYAYLELGQRSQGVAQLQKVIREYPKSDEASLARQRIKELGG
ncbi:MAG TPA: tol-pal system protein YbgF [Thermoanaerobaculia bacterium]|nr:tol-pal system protein YbgF [Thermoanaerobaculia bacterium]